MLRATHHKQFRQDIIARATNSRPLILCVVGILPEAEARRRVRNRGQLGKWIPNQKWCQQQTQTLQVYRLFPSKVPVTLLK